jgi:GxxExxY protein
MNRQVAKSVKDGRPKEQYERPSQVRELTIGHQDIGAAIEVHRILGPGFLESVYEEALAIEFDLRRYERQKPIVLQYKSRTVGDSRLDFLVGSELVVELKAVEVVRPIYPAKVIHYLKTCGLELGLIFNFYVALLRDGIKRIVLSKT